MRRRPWQDSFLSSSGAFFPGGFDEKTKVTQITPTDTKVEDIGLGSSANVEYIQRGDRNYLSSIEFIPAKSAE